MGVAQLGVAQLGVAQLGVAQLGVAVQLEQHQRQITTMWLSGSFPQMYYSLCQRGDNRFSYCPVMEQLLSNYTTYREDDDGRA